MTHRAAIQYLEQMATALALLGESPAMAAWYAQAARVLAGGEGAGWEAYLAGQRDAPEALPPNIEEELLGLARGESPLRLEALHLQVPPGLFELLALDSLDPTRVRTLWRALRIVTLRQLARACRRDRLARLDGFGPQLQNVILAEIEALHHRAGRWLRPAAATLAEETAETLRRVKGFVSLELAGEFRRALETVDELVWVLAAEQPRLTLGRLASLEGARLEEGPAADTVNLIARETPRRRIVVVPPSHAAVRFFLETGHENHTRELLARLAEEGAALEPLPASEEEIYARAGLGLIPPELREGRGEVAAAAQGRLPELVRPDELRGVLHLHTSWSDGSGSLRKMVKTARELGWEYVGVADHSEAAFYAGGLTPERLRKQAARIRELQPEFPDIRIFQGVECDILPDGSLDLPPEALEPLDFVVASVHSMLRIPADQMTARIVRAIEHPATVILGHPSGRMLLERESYPVDWDALFDAAARCEVAIEFNAPAERLDLDWRLIRAATGRGISICVNPDAHQPEALRNVFTGIETARKGWLTPQQVLNTKTAPEMEAYLRDRAGRARAAQARTNP